jgi:hypothetical protein
LKPLEPCEEGEFEPVEELAVIGVAITKFGEGWDLPPGVEEEPVENEEGECEGDSADEERLLDARFEDSFEGEEPPSDPEDDEAEEHREWM